MPTGPFLKAAVVYATNRLVRAFALPLMVLSAALLAGCAGMGKPEPAQTVVSAKPPREALPLDEATVSLADATLKRAQLPTIGSSGRYRLVIDPLIDRATGAETATTRVMESRISSLVRDRHSQFELRPFNIASLDDLPLVLLGAITGVTEAGSLKNATGPGQPPAYRIWAVLIDLASGRVIAHETAWVQAETVDTLPTTFFRDSPTWTTDDAAAAYLRTCALDPGAAIDPAYLRTIRVQALVTDGIRAYEAKRFTQALGFYTEARINAPADQQLRIRNGLYLANQALGRRQEAEAAFGEVVDYGLERGRLAVKFLFRTGSTAFWPDPAVSGAYSMWLRQIAEQMISRPICFSVEGHSSPTGPAKLNHRLSQARAERVRERLIVERPALRKRLAAEGVSSREPIVGTGADNASDVLDRRVEFEQMSCLLASANGASQ